MNKSKNKQLKKGGNIETRFNPYGNRPYRNFKKREAQHRINEFIRTPMVRIVGDNIETNIVSIKEALKIANDLGLDLVEISPDANPPVCKIIDYNKFLYEQKKKQKEIKAKTAKVVVKEIKLSPNIDDHDFNFKLKHAQNFLESGAKVKLEIFFKGRSIVYKEKGELVLLRFADQLIEYGKIENMPKLEGKRMLMLLSPKKKAN
ncbi:MAG: translation initiation factor IF-3 [Bacteroidales bacterium]|nr:translation initiation factor IF-3 [Bacteroidales bacterium]